MFQLAITGCNKDDAEELSDKLEETGTLSITMSDSCDEPILEPLPGATPLWSTVNLYCLYEDYQDAIVASKLLAVLYPNLSYAIEALPIKDWERVSKDAFVPQCFGDALWICPSWCEPPAPETATVLLDPGLAFGTGSHPTTALCLTWLATSNVENLDVIDYGCGSGILAVAALKLGAHHVCAIDYDTQALVATKSNAVNNTIDLAQLEIGLPEICTRPADIVLANILLTPLLELRQRFRDLLKKNGTLVVSGLLEAQIPTLIDAYRDEFIHQTTALQDGWALLMFKAN